MTKPTTFPVSAGLLEPRHVQAIDASSPWPIYLWFLNRVTRDEANGQQFDGIVLNGKPVGIEQIAAELGMKYRACRRHLARLVRKGYIRQKKTGRGTCSYFVTKSKKWIWKRCGKAESTDQNPASGSSDPQTGMLSLAGNAETSFGTCTDQKHVSAIRKKPQETTQNLKPQTSLVPSLKEPPQPQAPFPNVGVMEEQPKAKLGGRGTRIPADFVVTEKHRQFGRSLGADADYELEKFRDYWIAKAGKDGVKLDWDATFRNWLRKATEMNGKGMRKAISQHTDLKQIDYMRGLGQRNENGTYKF